MEQLAVAGENRRIVLNFELHRQTINWAATRIIKFAGSIGRDHTRVVG